MADDVTIVVRADNGQAIRAFRDVNGQLRDMSGRFVSEGNTMSGAMNRVSASIGGVKGSLVPLAAAAVPLAAALAPVAVKAAGAGVAVAAFGAAVAGQASYLSEAAEAQKKYTAAVAQHGQGSAQAAEAARMVATTLSAMPYATARAAVGLQTLKDTFQAWSDEVSGFTMKPVEKSFAVLGQVIPKLTPMAVGAADQLNRLVTVAGGAVASPGFDALSEKISTFANSALKDAVDGIIGFTRALSEGEANGPIKTFMDYANQNGPALRDTLSNVGDAVMTLVEAAADAGPGMLTLVNAAAGLVAALPPELVTVLLQTAVALKAVSLAGAAAGAIAGGVGTLGTRIAAMGAASAAAGGGLAGMNAALNTLSTGGKAMLAAGAVGALVLVMHQLSDNKAPVAVDKLSTSLNTLLSTGKLTGELKTNLREMSQSIAMVSKGASDNKFAQLTSDFGTFVGISTGPGISDARKNVDAWDKSMASLVKSGNPEQAAAQFELLKKAWVAGGGDLDRLKKFTDDYDNALADQKFELEMAAASMGVFGQAAQETSTKLETQKQSADGLRQSIEALNDANRSALGGMIGFEAAVDASAKAAAENAGSLDMINGKLDVNSPKAQAAATALNDLAAKTKDAALAARESGDSWETVNGIYERGRAAFIQSAQAMGLSRQEATQLAESLMNIPDEKSTRVTMRTEDAVAGLDAVISAMKKTPNSKSVTVKALTSDAVSLLESLGFKVQRMKDGRFKVIAETGSAKSNIAAVQRARDGLKNKTITLSARDKASATARGIAAAIANVRNKTVTLTTVRQTLGVEGTAGRNARNYQADGSVLEFYANGGTREQHVAQMAPAGTMRLWAEPETGGEAYIPLAQAKRSRSLAILEDVADRFGYGLEKFARGGVTKKEQEARNAARGELTISHFGRMAGYKNPEIRNQLGSSDSVGDLVSSLNKWRSVIKKTTHGAEESRLLRWLNQTGKALLHQEKKLLTVNKSLDKARGKLDSLKDSASQLAGSVKSGIIGGANITKAAGAEDSRVTINTLLSQMTGSAANSKQFSGMLKSLKGRGLRGDLIEQIAEAGIEGGGMETAAAVLGGGSREIKRLNDLQKQITANAGAAGKTTADAMYGAGVKAAEGLVKGLMSRQKVIEAGMMRIAKSMERGIKHALKIKSPSKVMEEIGGHTAEGFAVGMRKNRSVTPAWASMLNVPQGGSMATKRAAAGGGTQPIIVHQTITLDGRVVARQIFDPLREEIAHRGGNVQQSMGRGN